MQGLMPPPLAPTPSGIKLKLSTSIKSQPVAAAAAVAATDLQTAQLAGPSEPLVDQPPASAPQHAVSDQQQVEQQQQQQQAEQQSRLQEQEAEQQRQQQQLAKQERKRRRQLERAAQEASVQAQQQQQLMPTAAVKAEPDSQKLALGKVTVCCCMACLHQKRRSKPSCNSHMAQ